MYDYRSEIHVQVEELVKQDGGAHLVGDEEGLAQRCAVPAPEHAPREGRRERRLLVGELEVSPGVDQGHEGLEGVEYCDY